MIESEADLEIYDDDTPPPSDEDALLIDQCPPGVLAAMLRFIIPPKGATKRWGVAKVRLVLLAHMVGLEGVGEYPVSELARQLGLTRAALCHHSVRMVDSLKEYSARAGRTRETRALNAVRAKEVFKERGHGPRLGTGLDAEASKQRKAEQLAIRRLKYTKKSLASAV